MPTGSRVVEQRKKLIQKGASTLEKGSSRENAFASIPLEKVVYSADVSGVFAQVTCVQHYVNRSKDTVEAIYVFPLPEESVVTACEMEIGDKRIQAELKELKQARKEYDDAVEAGHHASLLEQKRENIFRMNVGGIEPGEKIVVTTTYLQRVPWQDSGGRFTIPLVVAPRFIPGLPSGQKTGGGWAEDTDEVPDASEITPVVVKDGVPYTADITVHIQAGFKCRVTSPSHGAFIGRHRTFNGKPIEISLTELLCDRDFVLCYWNRAEDIATATHIGSFDKKQFATISVVPPLQPIVSPKDVLFCLDISGSMTGAKLEGLKLVAEKVARRLKQENSDNWVGIVAFESHVHSIHPLSRITEATFKAIGELHPMGGTYAGRALDYCFQQFSALKASGDSGRERYILLVSDGQTEDRWRQVSPDVRVIAVGIDTAANSSYLHQIARETNGTSLAVYPGEDYDVIAGTLAGYLSGPILRDVKVMADKKMLDEAIGITDVYQAMPATVYLKTDRLPKQVTIQGMDALGQPVVLSIDLTKAAECTYAHQLWAREKLRDHQLSADQQCAISLGYGVLCSKTAFVAISLKTVPGAKPERVEIPVALPHTWDYDAVFGTGVPMSGFVAAVAGYAPPTLGIDRGRGHSFIARSHPTYGARFEAPDDSILFETGPPMTPDLPEDLPIPISTTLPVGSHPVDELENLVKALEAGHLKRPEAEAQWKVLKSKVSVNKMSLWTIEQKAKAYFLLVKLQAFGFTVSQVVLRAVAVKPDPSDKSAFDWWLKARRYLGAATASA